MKKLIFLLLMAVAMVGIISAWDAAAHPPGEITLEAELSSFSVAEGYAVILGSAPVLQDVLSVLHSGFIALSNGNYDNENLAVGTENDNKPLEIRQSVDYWLRL